MRTAAPHAGNLDEVVELLGLRFRASAGIDLIVDEVVAAVRDREDGCGVAGGPIAAVVTPNVDIVVQLESAPPAVADVYGRARWVLPDGQPIVLLSRLCGRPLPARLTGSDLFGRLWPRVVESAIPTTVVAANEALADRYRQDLPSARVLTAPVIDPSNPASIDEFAREVASGADWDSCRLLLLGLGHPRDAAILAALVEAGGHVPVTCCLGGSAEMYYGMRRRAPEWVQRMSLEWAYRLIQEPRRLAHRYLVRDRRFARLAVREWRASRGTT